MRALVIDVNDGRVMVRDFDADTRRRLQQMYDAIGCECIDIAVRAVKGHPFNIVCDDEGLLRNPETIRFGAIYGNLLPALAGTLIFFGIDAANGYDLTDITDEEAALVAESTYVLRHDDGRRYPCVVLDD